MSKVFQYDLSLGKVWDVCILTATNESQAAVYQLQLERIQRAGALSLETKYLVVSDPYGKRIGSGGATLHVLRKLESRLQEWAGNGRLTTSRILKTICDMVLACGSAA